jgi:phosphoenolpyruvate carboxylase
MEDEQDGNGGQESVEAQKSSVTQNEEEDDDNFMQLMDQIGAENVFDEFSHLIHTSTDNLFLFVSYTPIVVNR